MVALDSCSDGTAAICTKLDVRTVALDARCVGGAAASRPIRCRSPEGCAPLRLRSEPPAVRRGAARPTAHAHRLPHFSHIFDGGYSASYYAYTWAEAMDADGFDAFKEAGNVFDPELAAKLRREVYEVGNTRDPAESYKAFRGRMPTADALLRNRGLK